MGEAAVAVATEAAQAPAAERPSREAVLEQQIAKATEEMRTSTLGDEPEGEDEPIEAKPEPKKPTAKAKPGKTKEKAAAKPAETPETESADDAPPDVPHPSPSVDASPRALLKAGKVEEAFKKAFGEDFDPKQYQISSKNFAAFRHEVRKEREKLSGMEQRVEAKAAQLVQQFEPLVKAREAYKAGDYSKLIELISDGEIKDPTDFSRRLIAAKYNKDPHTEKLERELQELRAEREREKQELQARAQQESQKQAHARYMDGLRTQLGNEEDPRIAAALEDEDFLTEVFKVQKAHWDPHSQTTLPPREAAEMVLEKIQASYQKLARVFGSGAPINPAVTVQSGKTSAKPGARQAPRTLRQNEAAEAAARPNLPRDQLIDYFAEQMRVSTPD